MKKEASWLAKDGSGVPWNRSKNSSAQRMPGIIVLTIINK